MIGSSDLRQEALKKACRAMVTQPTNFEGRQSVDRLNDLADVQELIKIRNVDADFAAKLDPYVRTKYRELEEAVRKSTFIQEK